ncbi:MAG: DciA family protein [bacterium]
MRKNQPEPLRSIISNLLLSLGIDTKVKQHEAVVRWAKIVGPKISKVTEAKKVIDGVLFVEVKSNAWRSELIFLKRDIITKIDETIGATIIKDIRFI